MIVKIKHTKTGNCSCDNCHKVQEGHKLQPYTVWAKKDDKLMGHNFPVCSLDCAKELATKLQQENAFSKYNTAHNNF